MRRVISILVCLTAMLATCSAHAVTCQSNILPSNPDAAYTVDIVNGTAIDTRTGLMWKVCSEGQTWSNGTCAGSPQDYTWSDALAQADSTIFAGRDDWRLPNLKELRSLVEECRFSPSINDYVFHSDVDWPALYFWTSTPRADDGNGAWIIHFHNGGAFGDSNRGNPYKVRLVRGGQASGANRPPVISNATFGVTTKQLIGSFNVADADGDTVKNVRLTMRGSGFYCRTGYLWKSFDQPINTGLVNVADVDCAAEATRYMNETGGAVAWELELYDSKGAKATPVTGALNQQGSITVPQGSKVIWTDSVTDFEIGTGYTLQFKMVDAQNNVQTQYSSVGAINVSGVDVEMDGKRLVWFDNGVANVTGFKVVSAGLGEIEVSAPIRYATSAMSANQAAGALAMGGAVPSLLSKTTRTIKALSTCPANPRLYVRLEQSDGSPVGTGELQVGRVVNQNVPSWISFSKTGDSVELVGLVINPGDVYSIQFRPVGSNSWIDAGRLENSGKSCFAKAYTNKLAYRINGGKRPLILVPGIFGSTLDDKGNPYPRMPKSICKTKSDDCAKLEFYSALGDFLGWNELESRLTSMGYKVYKAPWDWRMGDLRSIAEQFLSPVIEQALRDSPGYTRVDVVAHSMGGLVTRAFIQNLGKANQIDRFVMLGTPNGGSVNAYYLMSAAETIKLDKGVQDVGAMLLKPDFYSNTANNIFRDMGMGALLSDGLGSAETNEGHGVSGYASKYGTTLKRREALKRAVPGGVNLLPLSTHDYLQAFDTSNGTRSNKAPENISDLAALYSKGSQNLTCDPSPVDRWGNDTDTNFAYSWLLLSGDQKTITSAKVFFDSSSLGFSNSVDDYYPSTKVWTSGALEFGLTDNSGDGTVPAVWAKDGLSLLGECIQQLSGGGHARMPGNTTVQSKVFDILRLNRTDIVAQNAANMTSQAVSGTPSFLNVQMTGPVVGIMSGPGGSIGIGGSSDLLGTLPYATYQSYSDLSSFKVSPVSAGTYQLQINSPVGFVGRLLPIDIHSNSAGVDQLVRGAYLVRDATETIKFGLSSLGALQLLDRPNRPRNMVVHFSADQQQTQLGWDASTDGVTTGYRVYSRLEGKQNFGLAATVSGSQHTHTANLPALASGSATPATEFVVVAIDAQGRESFASDIVNNARQEASDVASFPGQTTREANAWVVSSPVAMTAINVPVAISISGGEYKLDNGEFTAAPGTVQPGQILTVRVRSSGTPGQTSVATLTVGESTLSFSVTLSNTRNLTVGKTGRGSGRIVSNPPGIDCGTTCVGEFAVNSVVSLSPTPERGSRFAAWSGACSGSKPCSITMADDKSATATFTRKGNIAPIMAILFDSPPLPYYSASPAAGTSANGSTIWLRLDSISGSRANFTIGKLSGNFISNGVFRILNNGTYVGKEVNYTAGASTVSFTYELGVVAASHVVKAQRYDAANISGGYDSGVVSGNVTVNVTLR